LISVYYTSDILDILISGAQISSKVLPLGVLRTKAFSRVLMMFLYVSRNLIVWVSCTKWMTPPSEEYGWTSYFNSWRTGGLRSLPAPPSPRTPSTSFDSIPMSRREGVSWRYARCSVVPCSLIQPSSFFFSFFFCRVLA